MGSLRLDEVIVDALVKKLQNGWPDRIGQITAEKDDGMICHAPDPSLYFVGRVSDLPAAPACFVLAGPGQFREQGAHSMTTAYEIMVHVIEQDQTGPLLARRLMRQVRAVIECVYDDAPQEALNVANSQVISAYRIFPLRTIPGAVFQPSGPEGWRGSYVIVFRAEQEEL